LLGDRKNFFIIFFQKMSKAEQMRKESEQHRESIDRAKMDGAVEEYQKWIALVEKDTKQGAFGLLTWERISEGCVLLLQRDGFTVDFEPGTGFRRIRW